MINATRIAAALVAAACAALACTRSNVVSEPSENRAKRDPGTTSLVASPPFLDAAANDLASATASATTVSRSPEVVAAAPSPSDASTPNGLRPIPLADFLVSDAAQKTNAALKLELTEIARRADDARSVALTGQFTALPTDAERATLTALGVHILSGNTFTATLAARDVPKLAALPVVLRLEKSPTMHVRPPKIAP